MKTFLKFFITIAIVVGIVFGIIQLVNINRPNDYVYAHITSSNFETKTNDKIMNKSNKIHNKIFHLPPVFLRQCALLLPLMSWNPRMPLY